MSEDIPADVRAVLAQLFAEGRDALRAEDRETAVETVTTAETVATNKLPEGTFRDRLLHGCERVRRLLAPADSDGDDLPVPRDQPGEAASDVRVGAGEDRVEAAAAYLAAMEQRVTDAGNGG